ncbi:hypothetical protein VNO80_09214 [Phaseolus coccineus]|uniref:Uncharacterized protein n=1 Tax=Phaseolus coccineus TaxID=3886 RepID=A0AAN9R9B0_PHACN
MHRLLPVYLICICAFFKRLRDILRFLGNTDFILYYYFKQILYFCNNFTFLFLKSRIDKGKWNQMVKVQRY